MEVWAAWLSLPRSLSAMQPSAGRCLLVYVIGIQFVNNDQLGGRAALHTQLPHVSTF